MGLGVNLDVNLTNIIVTAGSSNSGNGNNTDNSNTIIIVIMFIIVRVCLGQAEWRDTNNNMPRHSRL